MDFLSFKWLPQPGLYAIYATVCCVYTLAMTVYSGFDSPYGAKILIWMTYWGYYSLTLRFTVTAVNAWRNVVWLKYESEGEGNVFDESAPSPESEREESGERRGSSSREMHHLPPGLALQWLLQNISNSVSLLVTVLFWALVYTGVHQTYMSINSHAINSLLVLADVMLSAAPIHMLHFHMPLVYLMIYIAFTLIYWAGNGTNHRGEPYIYSVLDYSGKPKVAIVVIVCVALIIVPLTQVLLCGLRRLREKIHAKLRLWKDLENPTRLYQRQ
ncbi:protein rolling stone isoform X2 [Aplysia californica]|nr:protein rolling stone isoform X2 [Aplysia californica]XP_012940203.1 protein rolling stone isoform X2 [Aplysia californica]XP_035826648.1 protein rolling stone isoform X2 [Aplysia californica]